MSIFGKFFLVALTVLACRNPGRLDKNGRGLVLCLYFRVLERQKQDFWGAFGNEQFANMKEQKSARPKLVVRFFRVEEDFFFHSSKKRERENRERIEREKSKEKRENRERQRERERE